MTDRIRAARRLGAGTAILVCALVLAAAPALASLPHEGRSTATGSKNGNTPSATAGYTTPGGTGSGGGSGVGGPNCTTSDGTPAYYSYEGLLFTTMEEQRTEIRPEEQRPGVYLHVSCGGQYRGLQFFPDEAPIDPRTLAQSVTIDPPVPARRRCRSPGR